MIAHLHSRQNCVKIEVSDAISDLLCAFETTASFICYHLRADERSISQI